MVLASEQYEAAGKLRELGHHRASVSRAYYAAFAAVHAVLLGLGRSSPRSRFGTWSHETLPDTLVNDLQLSGKLPKGQRSSDLTRKLRALKSDREIADYAPGLEIGIEDAVKSLRSASAFRDLARRLER